MKKMSLKLAFAAALVAGALAIPAPSQAVGCNPNFQCPDVWKPVICSDGHVYSNSCYAARACATGCVPYGDTI